uniref:Uncharacterized protein n=1 Tax=Meleagris gallopavo TaxID=9103 RepID=A0A803Y320_MELGA
AGGPSPAPRNTACTGTRAAPCPPCSTGRRECYPSHGDPVSTPTTCRTAADCCSPRAVWLLRGQHRNPNSAVEGRLQAELSLPVSPRAARCWGRRKCAMGARALSKAKPCLSTGLGRGAAPGPAAGSLRGGMAWWAPGAPGNTAAGPGRSNAQEAAGLGRAGHTALPAAPGGTAARLRAQLRDPSGKAWPAREGPALPARRPPFLLAAAHCSGTELMGQDSPFPDFH